MTPNSWGYAIREALRSIRRNSLMSLASISTVGLCLVCFAAVYIISVNLGNVARVLESQVEIRAFIAEGTDSKRVKEIETTIAGYAEVLSVKYVSKDEALRRLRQQFADQRDLLAGIEDANPLPASFEMTLKTPEKVKDVADAVSRLKGVESVSYKSEMVERLFLVTRALRLIGTGLVVALAVATVALVSNTIRLTLYARRKEIAIMKLVGATDGFIRAPFVFEGLLLGITGAGFAALLSRIGYLWLFVNVPKVLPFIPLVAPSPLVDALSMILVGAGAVMGAAGSGISIRRFMRI
ncbi:MAG: ABC transporter permease [Firmicutes bacterium]|nr:ABC transporter permease [Bacillota bacterium]